MANDYLDLPDSDDKKPGTGLPNVPGAPSAQAAPAPAAPAAAAPAAPQAPPPAPTANDLILQHLGQGGIGSDRVAAPPRQDSWWDALPGTKYYGEPAQPGPQSWFDWFSKEYKPSAADIATVYGNEWSYGLSPLALQGAQAGAKGLQNATGSAYDPFPAGLTPEAMRARIQEAQENVGPGIIPLSAAAMATQPLNYTPFGPGALSERVAARVAPNAAELAAKVLPENIAKYVPEQLFPNMAKGGAFTGDVAAAHTAGAGGSPEDIGKSFLYNLPAGAGISAVANLLPLGRATPEDIVNKTIQAAQGASSKAASTTVPSKNLGFTIEGQQDPSVLNVMEYKKWLESQGVQSADVQPSAEIAAKGQAAVDRAAAPQEAYGEDEEGARQALSAQIVKNANKNPPPGDTSNLPTAQERMLTRINQALAQPDVQPALKAAQVGSMQTQAAAILQQMWNRLGAEDPRPAALKAMDLFPEGSPAQQAFRNIAATPDASPLLSRTIRSGLSAIGGGLGEAANIAGGGHVPWGGGAAAGAGAANWLGNAFEDIRGGGNVTPLVRQTIAKQYPTLTGQPAPGPGGNQALANALLRLYQGF
jgi:hypothetical protein